MIEMFDETEMKLVVAISNRTGKAPTVMEGLVRYSYRNREGAEDEREIEFGAGTKYKKRIDALRTALMYAGRDHIGEKLA